MGTFRYASETLHIALVSLSQGKTKSHINAILKDYYESYKKDIDFYSSGRPEKNSHLYQPLEYYMLGNYDVALISIVNNYKFAQKQITPRTSGSITDHEPYQFQVITGSCPIINNDFDVKTFFKIKKQQAEAFVCISNLKLNNKLLIGNGNVFLELVLKKIDKTIREVFRITQDDIPYNYFLQQTYSWCEITVVTFSDKISLITQVITSLRKLTFKDLFHASQNSFKHDMLKNSLYEKILKSSKEYDDINPHVFADSHSYFGVRMEALSDVNKKKLLSQKLKTEIEWQVKPGHFANLVRELKKIRVNGKPVFSNKNYFLTGKTDFFIQEKTDSFLNNVKLIEKINNSTNIFKYVRKVKSRALFEYVIKKGDVDTHSQFHVDFKTLIKVEFSDKIPPIERINDTLKELKVSRNIRSKISKIFFNYQIGIQDPILFTYFLDFKIFIDRLLKLITTTDKIYKSAFKNGILTSEYSAREVNSFENSLVKLIEIFDEGYTIRMLNCNQYEDINDFDLDFNSSVQQILSMYGTIAVNLGNIFFIRNTHGQVVQLNLKNTVSNSESINYDVYHLTCPEFVLFSLLKEVMNKYTYNDQIITKKDSKAIKEIMKQLNEEFFESTNLNDPEIVDFEYFFIDAIRFIHTCNFDFELFEYWSWSYTFQNASLYDKAGCFNEGHFRMEVLRLFFIARLFAYPLSQIKCPLPEIYYLWERHVKSLTEIVNLFFEKNSQLLSSFKVKALTVFRYPQNFEFPLNFDSDQLIEPLEKNINEFLSEFDEHFFWKKGKGQSVLLSLNITKNSKAIAESISSGIPVYCENGEQEKYLFINSFIYAYLKLIFTKNGKVRLLRRNWQDGKPLLSFINSNEKDDFLYSVDQFGGIFFSSNKNSEEYFKIRNAAMQSLWHYSLLCKKSIYF